MPQELDEVTLKEEGAWAPAQCCAPLTDLAGLAGVAVWTGAVVLVRLGVHAGASVDARLVSAAVVEIWTGGEKMCVHTHAPS